MDEGEKPTESSEEAAPGSSVTSEETASTETGEAASAEESTAANAAEETLDNIFGSPADHSLASTSSGIRGKNPMLDTMLDTRTETVESPTRNNPPSTEEQGTFKVPAAPTSPMRTPKKKKPLEGLGAVLLESHRSGAITKSPKQKGSPPTRQSKSRSASGTIRGPSTSQSGKSISAFENALRQFSKAEEAWDYSMKTLKAYEKSMTRSLPEMLENVSQVATPAPDVLLTYIQGTEEMRKLIPVIDLTDSDSNSPNPPLDVEVSSEPRSASDVEISSEPRSASDAEISSEPRSASDVEISSETISTLDTEVSSETISTTDTEVSSESKSALDAEEANESRSAMDTEELSESKSAMDTDEISESVSAMDTEELSGPKSHMEDLSESKSAMDTEDLSESRSDMDTEELTEPKSATASEDAGQVKRIAIAEEDSPTDNLPAESRKTDLPTPEKSAEEKRVKIQSRSSTQQYSQESIAKESDIGEETSGETDEETVEETPETSASTSSEDADKPKRRISSETSHQKASKQPRL